MIKKFKSFSRNKQLLIGIATFIFLGLIITLALNAFLFHHRQYYFGTVSAIQGNQLVVTTKFGNERSVLITPQTKISHVKITEIIPLSIGQRIMVISSENDVGQREAKTIRLFR